MKWFVIALCIALFCVGLIESAPTTSSSEVVMKFRKRLKRAFEEASKVVEKDSKKDSLYRDWIFQFAKPPNPKEDK
ncbi:hypothetical protein Y032_0087g2103 [Ancylostoma ceylanicum]|uniref:Uncharacterized protein n=1 Tax=Ancylostoma ceylanicum TaxID=53326 RepID=A0A016TPG8_9BILA|nr:hypothetical protein Y032_0087g2103 [Ancylostoma ceylanicum]